MLLGFQIAELGLLTILLVPLILRFVAFGCNFASLYSLSLLFAILANMAVLLV
jgi:hypothetical protein